MDQASARQLTPRAFDVLLRAAELASSEEELGDIRALACHYTHIGAIDAAIAKRRRELERVQ